MWEDDIRSPERFAVGETGTHNNPSHRSESSHKGVALNLQALERFQILSLHIEFPAPNRLPTPPVGQLVGQLVRQFPLPLSLPQPVHHCLYPDLRGSA